MNLRIFFFCIGFSFLIINQTDAQKYAVHFKDKNGTPYSLNNPSEFLSQRALDRRERFNIQLNEDDLPVNPDYINQVGNTGATILFSSKWINAVLIGTENDDVIAQIKNLACVDTVILVYPFSRKKEPLENSDKFELEQQRNILIPVKNTTSVYGSAYNQIAQLNGVAVHEKGYRGTGVLIAVFDGGFANVNIIDAFKPLFSSNLIIMAKDFVEPNGNIYVPTLSAHGTSVLSCMAANVPNEMIGTAPDASYCLFRTEDTRTEYPIEEYNWVVGAETADSIGVDIINSSLIYTTFGNATPSHTYADMDGKTTIASIGARGLVERGVFVCTAAGNSGNDASWPWIGTPADVVEALTVGAVNASGAYASFSSIGPNAAGDQKPNTMAQGAGSAIINADGYIISGSGTSYASPITCGMTACLIQACANKTPDALRTAIEASSSLYANPSNKMGYGIPDFYSILQTLSVCEGMITEKIRAYPNPTTDCIQIRTTEILKNAVVYDLLGRKIFEQPLSDNRRNSLCLESLCSGIYMVQICAKTGAPICLKIVKE